MFITYQQSANVNFNFGSILIFILAIVEEYYILQKANLPGWQAIIPIYRDYLYYKVANRPGDFIKHFFATLFSSITIFAAMFYYTLKIIWMAQLLEDTNVALTIDAYYENLFTNIINRPGASTYALVLLLIGIALAIYACVIDFRKCKAISEAFHMEPGFKWGLFFLPIIFNGILAFDRKNQYHMYDEVEEDTLNYNGQFYNE